MAQRDRSVVQSIELFNLLLNHAVRFHPLSVFHSVSTAVSLLLGLSPALCLTRGFRLQVRPMDLASMSPHIDQSSVAGLGWGRFWHVGLQRCHCI